MQTEELALPFRFFDPKEDCLVIERRLPHWSQPGTVCFLTWRCWDFSPAPSSIPGLPRSAWLLQHGIDVEADNWQDQLAQLPLADQRDFHSRLSARWEAALDEGHGACVLRRPELGRIVANSLRHFDEDRYLLTDFVVMPNHAHVLAVFPDPKQMLIQCESWKHFTATRINKILGQREVLAEGWFPTIWFAVRSSLSTCATTSPRTHDGRGFSPRSTSTTPAISKDNRLACSSGSEERLAERGDYSQTEKQLAERGDTSTPKSTRGARRTLKPKSLAERGDYINTQDRLAERGDYSQTEERLAERGDGINTQDRLAERGD